METAIAVEREGLTLGWKLVVAIAACSLGLYVTVVVSPLQKDIAEQRATIERLESKLNSLHALSEKLNLHMVSADYDHSSFERENARLNERMTSLEGKLHAYEKRSN